MVPRLPYLKAGGSGKGNTALVFTNGELPASDCLRTVLTGLGVSDAEHCR